MTIDKLLLHVHKTVESIIHYIMGRSKFRFTTISGITFEEACYLNSFRDITF